MKYLSLFLSLMILYNCRHNSPETPVETPKTPVETPVETPSSEVKPIDPGSVACNKPIPPVGPEYPIKDAKKVFTARIVGEGYSKEGQDKLSKAEALIVKVVNSEEFKEKILNHTYEGKKTFVDNDGLSNEQIFKKLFEGAESLMPAVNYQMDLTAVYYFSRLSSTIGYTYPDVMKVYTNGKYHNYYTACEVAGNLFHEWLHKIGFGHAAKYSSSRDYSVPYAVGYILEETCKKESLKTP